jgi:hypothetical protein
MIMATVLCTATTSDSTRALQTGANDKFDLFFALGLRVLYVNNQKALEYASTALVSGSDE